MIAKLNRIEQLEHAADERAPRMTASPGVAPDLPRIEAAVREILLAVGEDPDRPGLLETPRRVARAYAEMLRGLHEDPGTHLRRVFAQDSDEAVILRDIPFHSVCEHHLLPFHGKAHLAYLPSGGRVVGLSKLARTLDVFARRPQMQERLTQQVADALDEHLAPRGVAVILEGAHQCLAARGAAKHGATMVTSAYRGELAENVDMKLIVTDMLLHERHTRRIAAEPEPLFIPD